MLEQHLTFLNRANKSFVFLFKESLYTTHTHAHLHAPHTRTHASLLLAPACWCSRPFSRPLFGFRAPGASGALWCPAFGRHRLWLGPPAPPRTCRPCVRPCGARGPLQTQRRGRRPSAACDAATCHRSPSPRPPACGHASHSDEATLAPVTHGQHGGDRARGCSAGSRLASPRLAPRWRRGGLRLCSEVHAPRPPLCPWPPPKRATNGRSFGATLSLRVTASGACGEVETPPICPITCVLRRGPCGAASAAVLPHLSQCCDTAAHANLRGAAASGTCLLRV